MELVINIYGDLNKVPYLVLYACSNLLVHVGKIKDSKKLIEEYLLPTFMKDSKSKHKTPRYAVNSDEDKEQFQILAQHYICGVLFPLNQINEAYAFIDDPVHIQLLGPATTVIKNELKKLTEDSEPKLIAKTNNLNQITPKASSPRANGTDQKIVQTQQQSPQGQQIVTAGAVNYFTFFLVKKQVI